MQEFIFLTFEELADGDVRPGCDHFGDIIGRDLFLEHPLVGLQFGEGGLRLLDLGFGGGQPRIFDFGGLLVLAAALGLFFFGVQGIALGGGLANSTDDVLLAALRK